MYNKKIAIIIILLIMGIIIFTINQKNTQFSTGLPEGIALSHTPSLWAGVYLK